MSRLPVLRYREIEAVLLGLGFEMARQRGSHVFFRHPDGRTTTVPKHPDRYTAPPLLRQILSEAGLTREEFLARLNRR